MKKVQPVKRKSLQLQPETVRELRTKHLTEVVGGIVEGTVTVVL